MTPHDMAVTRLACSWLLWYPDEALAKRVPDIRSAIQDLPAEATQPLTDFLAWMSAQDPLELAKEYVQTFDMKRKACPYLTYWTHGDTRNRGAHMHEFTAVYRGAGAEPPTSESPDHLPVVLEFAAIVDPRAGRRLLAEHRMAIEVLLEALTERESCYADAVAAVCATLPAVTDQETRRARRLAEAGPPAEAVGLQPFTLTVPPRRAEGAG